MLPLAILLIVPVLYLALWFCDRLAEGIAEMWGNI
jgi:hypothetical protein